MRAPPLNWVLDRLLLAEKTTALQEQSNYYVFRANPQADRQTIRRAVETVYGVKVEKIQVLNQVGKTKRSKRGKTAQANGRTARWKKAYVRLAEGHSIEMPEQA